MSGLVVDQATARAQFPSLASGFAFLENAGGSQVPKWVIDAMSQFLCDSYVQTTAGYPHSDRATAVAEDAHAFCETFMGVDDTGKVILGPSTSQLLFNLAVSMAPCLKSGDEVIVSVANHEANIGPWLWLEQFGVVVKWWSVDSETGHSSLEELAGLLTDRTKIVAFPHTSNLLGNIADIRAITDLVHSCGARVVVDGVAYAPHAAMDVATWGVDFYVYSTYKVYGPHMAALYGRSDALEGLRGQNHFFVADSDWPRKFELGCLSFEGCAGLVALGDYLCLLSGHKEFQREAVILATAQMRAWERPLTERLLDFLKSRSSVRVVGPLSEDRMPTVCFVSSRVSSPSVAEQVNGESMGIRYGHMYSHRLTEALGVDPTTAFVRVSAVHYNTVDEIERLCRRLDEIGV